MPEQRFEQPTWVVADGLIDPLTSDAELAELMALATPAEIDEALRRLRLEAGAEHARRDQLRARRAEIRAAWLGGPG